MKIYKAIEQAKSEIGVLSKDSTNPFYNSKYFDINQLLAHTEPILKKHGLMVMQPVRDGAVVTRVIHIESGEVEESGIPLPDLNDPQKIGSAITYYRRYTLQSLLALQAEDDDANHAAGKTPKKKEEDDNKPWLNLFTKSGEETKEYLAIDKAIADGKQYELKDIRKKYKVSKQTAGELKDHFNIQ